MWDWFVLLCVSDVLCVCGGGVARNSQWDAEALHTIVFLASLMAGTQEQDGPLDGNDLYDKTHIDI